MNRSGGHIFYDLASALTVAHYAAGHGPVVEVLGQIADVFNPLSLPSDLFELWDTLDVVGDPNDPIIISLDSGVLINTNISDSVTASQAVLDQSGLVFNQYISPHDLFMSGNLCIEGVCAAPIR